MLARLVTFTVRGLWPRLIALVSHRYYDTQFGCERTILVRVIA